MLFIQYNFILSYFVNAHTKNRWEESVYVDKGQDEDRGKCVWKGEKVEEGDWW